MSMNDKVCELIDQMKSGRYYTEEGLMGWFGWSRSTLYRVMQRARDNGEEIVNERGRGFKLIPNRDPKKWRGFAPQELEMLAMLSKMLGSDEGWTATYEREMRVLRERVRREGIPPELWENRLHYIIQHKRRVKNGVFRKVSDAVLHRKVIRFNYRKADNSAQKREVHPQQLIFYRNGWSMDALDPAAVGKTGENDSGLRQFALDMIDNVREVKKKWQEVSPELLKEQLTEGYGLFAGRADAAAVIEFRGVAAFYVERELWHPQQVVEQKENGLLRLRVPYVSKFPDELIGDILRWGSLAKVTSPPDLKKRWKEKILEMAKIVS